MIYGEGVFHAFENGDWRGVNFRGQDLSGISFRGANLLNAHWDAATNVNGASFNRALIDKGLLAATGLATAQFDDDQQALVRRWRAENNLPLGVPLAELTLELSFALKPSDYHALIHEAPDFATAAHWLEAMRAAGFQPNNIALTTVVAKPRKPGTEQVIREIVLPIIAIGQADQRLINAALGNVDSLEEARYWFDQLNIMGFRPDLFSFNGLIRRCDLAAGLALIAEMEQLGLEPDYYSYNPLIRNASNINDALKIVDDMKRRKISLRPLDFYQLFYVSSGEREIELVRSKMFEANVPLDTDCFNRIIQNCGSFELAKKYWDELISLGLKPDKFTVNALGRMCSTPDEVVEALQIMRLSSPFPDLGQTLRAIRRVDPGGHADAAIKSANAARRPLAEVVRASLRAYVPNGEELFLELFPN